MELAQTDGVGDATEAVFERFQKFEVSATKATKEEERQQLLGVIELRGRVWRPRGLRLGRAELV